LLLVCGAWPRGTTLQCALCSYVDRCLVSRDSAVWLALLFTLVFCQVDWIGL